MKKLYFIFFALIILMSNSFASFPVSDTLNLYQDSITKESAEDYHLRLQKMGFEMESIKKDDNFDTKMLSGSFFLTGFSLMLVSLITFTISMLDFFSCVDRTETCNQSGIPYFILSFVFFFSSIFYFIRGFIIKSKRVNISDA